MSFKLPCGAVIDTVDNKRVLALGTGWHVPKRGGWAGYAILHLVVPGTWRPGKRGRRRVLALHRVVMNARPNELIDHKDGVTLNCRKRNLRRATKRINAPNMRRSKNQKRGGYKGVFSTGGKSKVSPWRSHIGRTENGRLRLYHLGYFRTAEAAARAYDKKARELFGKHAATNFPTRSK